MRGEIFKTIIDNYKQLFLSRHTARTICLIRIAHSSVRQFDKTTRAVNAHDSCFLCSNSAAILLHAATLCVVELAIFEQVELAVHE